MITNIKRVDGSEIYLLPFENSDITSEYISWLNDPDVVRFSNQRFIRHTIKSSQIYLKSFKNTTNFFLTIRRQIDDLPIGTMTVYFSTHHKTANIGILIGQKSLWGQGLGQDAWDTITAWLIDSYQIRKVIGGTLSNNKAMIRIMERSGMRCEAIIPRQELFNSKEIDLYYYAKYSSEDE